MERWAYRSEWFIDDPSVLVRARAFGLGVLKPELRDETAIALEQALLKEADTTFLKEDVILSLIPPTRLLRLASKIRDVVLAELPSRAASVAEDDSLDLDLDPTDHFTHLRTSLDALQSFFEEDESVAELLSEAESGIDEAIQSVESKKEDKEKEERDKARREEEEAAYWEEQTPARAFSATSTRPWPIAQGIRSIFSDVDE